MTVIISDASCTLLCTCCAEGEGRGGAPDNNNGLQWLIAASHVVVCGCSLLTESGEREKALERKVDALTRENAELKAQLRQKEGGGEVEGLLRLLVERVGKAETGGARRHNEVRMHTFMTS